MVSSSPAAAWQTGAALVPVIAASIWFFGPSAVLVLVTCVAACLITERLFGSRPGSVADGSAMITGLLLGLPIGMILHLVFDGAWNDTDTFWWPFTGLELDGGGSPIVERGWLSVVLEAIGLAICVWIWRTNGFGRAERRRDFLRTGQLRLGRL